MFLHQNLNKQLGRLLILLLWAAPVLAHEIEVSSNVAATFHIEPNHQPQAGMPAKAWFALTRRGGQIIPLSQCNCQLAVYQVPRLQGSTIPLLTPPLSSLNVEQYQGIPQAMIIFPAAGLYELELRGTAKSGASFQPFRFTFKVTVRR